MPRTLSYYDSPCRRTALGGVEATGILLDHADKLANDLAGRTGAHQRNTTLIRFRNCES